MSLRDVDRFGEVLFWFNYFLQLKQLVQKEVKIAEEDEVFFDYNKLNVEEIQMYSLIQALVLVFQFRLLKQGDKDKFVDFIDYYIKLHY